MRGDGLVVLLRRGGVEVGEGGRGERIVVGGAAVVEVVLQLMRGLNFVVAVAVDVVVVVVVG